MKRLGELVDLTKEHIHSEKLQNIVIDFVYSFFDIEMSSFQEWSLVKYFNEFLSHANLIENFDWDDYCSLHLELKSEVKTITRQYFKYLLENDLYFGEYREYLINNTWILDFQKGIYPQDTFYKGSKPYYFYQLHIGENNSVTRFTIKTDNMFIKSILITFISTFTNTELKITRFKVFIKLFQDSLNAYNKELNSIKDFNINTFRKQYRFYNKLLHHDHKLTFILCRFYLFIYDYLENEGIDYELFNATDGIDKYYLYRQDFATYYDEGYRVIYLNEYDEIPTIDRWMVAPNGQEITSLVKSASDYKPIGFHDINDEKYKIAFKSWYWYYDQSIYSKEKDYYCIKNFHFFLNRLRKGKSSRKIIPLNGLKEKNNYDISMNDVINFRIYLNSKYQSSNTVKLSLSAVKKFLIYAKEENLLDFNENILNYFDGVKKYASSPKSLTIEDLNKITKRYKELSNNGTFEKLQYCIYILLTTTNYRVREILNLKRNCFDDTFKPNQFVVLTVFDIDQKIPMDVKRKSRDGILTENISIYTYRILSEAIKLTFELSQKADSSVKDYIFLYTATHKIIRGFRNYMITDYFDNVLKDVGLEKFYAFDNLRDTYMTTIYDEGKKRGLSIEEIHPATGHKDITTTIKNYRNSDIRRYLEAFYKIKIGNVDINGTVIESVNDLGIETNDIKSTVVSEDCGYCKNRGCKNTKKIDCLICSFFVTTLDNLGSFKNRITLIDISIKNEPNDHEKEHLLKIKQLLLNYIERLYLLKEDLLYDSIKQN